MAIELKNVVKEFGKPATQVLKDISISVADGEFICITGRSGAGKSTLLYIMSTLDTPSSGSVKYSGNELSHMTPKAMQTLRNQNIGFVFQFHYLLPDLTVLENVLMPTFKTHAAQEKKQRASQLLEQFGLSHRAHHLPAQISGGERQRASLARALIMQPRYIFADEPTGSLDSVNGDSVMKILRETNENEKTTIVYVTHNEEYAAMAKRRIRMLDGRVVEEN